MTSIAAASSPTESSSGRIASTEYDVTEQLSSKEARTVAYGAMVGTAMEWYDFFLFNTAAALIFNVQFFSGQGSLAARLSSFATLAVGFAARPIGGIIFGILGDKVGRRAVLMTTVIGIGVITGLIGLLPSYYSIGLAAPILLTCLRLLQGIFVGGEWSGAMTIAVEHAPLHERARFAALPQVGSPIGTILSSAGFFIIAYLLSDHAFTSWGWRIPFLIAFPLVLIAMWIRSRMEESPVFRRLQEEGEGEQTPMRTVIRDTWQQILIGCAVALLGVGGFYLVTTFVVSYGRTTLGLSSPLLLAGTLIAAIFEVPVILTGGRLAARFGASKVIIWGGVASALLAAPCFLMVQSRNPVLVVLAMIIGEAAVSYPYAASGTVLTGLFPANTRYSGVAAAQNLSGAISGFIPMIAVAVVALAGNTWWPAAVLLAVISAITVTGGLVAPRLSQDLPGFKH